MYEKPKKAIQIARNRRGFTQEDLAEHSHYSVDSIRVWESGGRPAPISAIMALAEKLEAPWLPLFYLREQYGDGFLREVVPEFEVGRPVSEAAAAFISCMLEMVDEKFDRQLLRMVADGRIDRLELPDYKQILDWSWLLMKAALTMAFSSEEGNKNG